MSKLKIYQKKIRGCDDSFFYDGLIAEKGDFKLSASGEIRILNKKGELVHDGIKERGEGLKIENDKDLLKVDGENYYFDENNWFEIWKEGTNEEFGVFYSYSQALERLKSLNPKGRFINQIMEKNEHRTKKSIRKNLKK